MKGGAAAAVKRNAMKQTASGRGTGQKQTVEEGLRKLAFGDVSDVIRLLYAPPDLQGGLEGMDFFNISELKKGKDGVLEIKFYDRMKALQCLEEMQNGHKETAPLYEALRESCRLLSESGPEEEKPHED